MSTIFFNKISVIDHSKILPNGSSIGGSYNLNFTATLPVEKMDEEQVVVDFSSGKKEVKQVVDQHLFDPNVNGWDHKTWFIEGPSIQFSEKDNRGKLETPYLIMEGPLDAFRRYTSVTAQDSITLMEAEFAKFIGSALNTTKTIPIDYKVVLDEKPYPNVMMGHRYVVTRMFRYQHGLRNSSSYGCQNILHGHLSFVRVAHSDRESATFLAERIAKRLDGAYIYHKEIQVDTNKFAYSSQRGEFVLEFLKPQPLVSLTTEPTIENIFDYILTWVRQQYSELMDGLLGLEISEGLQKGATLK